MKNVFKLVGFLSCVLFFTVNISAQQETNLKAILAKNAKPVIQAFRDAKTGLYGYKNTKTDKILVPAKYQFAVAFTDGLGAVNSGGKVFMDNEYEMDYVCKAGKWGYVDSLGAVIIPIKYDAADEFHDGYSAVQQKGLKALIAKDGKLLTEFKYEYIYPFSEGLAVVGRGKPLKFTYMDAKGLEILPCDMDEANSFFRGKAKVVRYGATYFINTKGERVK